MLILRTKRLKKLLILSMLLLTNLACMALTQTWCVWMDGGDWVYETGQSDLDGWCETKTKHPLGDGQISQSNTSIEDCLATPDMYTIEFTGLHKENTDTSSLCRSTFTVSNHSNEQLSYKSFLITENTDEGHSEKWLAAFSLQPGEVYKYGSSYKSVSQGASDNGMVTLSSIGNYTKIIVFRAKSECQDLISDENEATWNNYAIELDCPCND